MKILAMPGSLRKDSSSYKIIDIVSELFPEHEWIVFDGLRELPHFDDNQLSYPEVDAFRKLLQSSDAVMICTPEYAFGVPGSLKNALDWTVSSGEFVDKPVALITASSQGQHAHAAMKLILTAIQAKLDNEATLLISFIRTKFDQHGKLKDPVLGEDIKKVGRRLIAMCGS